VDIAAGKLRLVNADVGYIVSTLVFQIIFSGCGEELYFRGMYQGEVDRVCGKTFRIGGTHFGFGAIVGALAFGLAHLELSNFMEWGFLDLKTLVAVCLTGLFLGFVREFVGCIFIVGFLHASFDTYRSLVQPSVPGRVVHVAAIGLVCYLVFSRRIHAGAATAKPSTGGDAQGPVLQPERSTAN
jgi:membrane protease YdiL (CAAX protease family)